MDISDRPSPNWGIIRELAKKENTIVHCVCIFFTLKSSNGKKRMITIKAQVVCLAQIVGLDANRRHSDPTGASSIHCNSSVRFFTFLLIYKEWCFLHVICSYSKYSSIHCNFSMRFSIINILHKSCVFSTSYVHLRFPIIKALSIFCDCWYEL